MDPNQAPSMIVALDTLVADTKQAIKKGEPGDKYTAIEGAVANIFLIHQQSKRYTGVEELLISSLYSYSQVYQIAKNVELMKTGMSTVFLGIVGEKCTDAQSWLQDVFLGADEKPWRLKATPSPTVPPQLSAMALASGVLVAKDYLKNLGRQPAPEDGQKAASLVRQAMQDSILLEVDRRAKLVERKIDDQLTEGGWKSALLDFIFDVVVTKAGILKGPITRSRQKLSWKTGKDGKSSASYKWEPTLTVSRVSPFDAYPSASTVGFEGDFIERTRYTINDLYWMLKQKHFIESQVRYVINRFQGLAGGDLRVVDSTLAPILQRQTGIAKIAGTVEGLDFWLTVTGQFLINCGWKELPISGAVTADELYNVEIISAGGKVVFIGENEDPRGLKPYFKTGWQGIPGSFWYRGLPEILLDIGDIGNASARSLVNNMGLASGFQGIIPDIQRVIPGSLTNMFPHKTWQFRNPTGSSVPPISFVQPETNAAVLINVIEKCREWADSRSGVPKYLVGGSPPPGVGRTSSGISMLLNSAAKGIRRVVINIDQQVICPLLGRIYEKDLIDSKDASVMGDVEVAPAGAVETLIKTELAEKRLGLLEQIEKSEDRGMISAQGRSELWREAFRSAEMEGPALMVPIEKIEQQAAAEDAAALQKTQAESQAAQADAQAKQLQVQVEQAKLEVEKQRLTMETQILNLKLQAQIAENQARRAVTNRMAASVDLKTAKELGAANVPTQEERNNAIRNEAPGLAPVEPAPAPAGVPNAGAGAPAELPGAPGELAPAEGQPEGQPNESGPGSGAGLEAAPVGP